jgi:hypothetical protein
MRISIDHKTLTRNYLGALYDGILQVLACTLLSTPRKRSQMKTEALLEAENRKRRNPERHELNEKDIASFNRQWIGSAASASAYRHIWTWKRPKPARGYIN